MAQEDRVTHRKCCPGLHLVLCSPLTPGKRNPVSRSSSLAQFHNSVLMEVFASRKEISLYSLCSNKRFQRVLEPSCLASTGLSLLLWSVRNKSSLALPVCRPTWPLSSKPCTSQISSACAFSVLSEVTVFSMATAFSFLTISPEAAFACPWTQTTIPSRCPNLLLPCEAPLLWKARS